MLIMRSAVFSMFCWEQASVWLLCTISNQIGYKYLMPYYHKQNTDTLRTCGKGERERIYDSLLEVMEALNNGERQNLW